MPSIIDRATNDQEWQDYQQQQNQSSTIDKNYNDWIASIKPGGQPAYQGATNPDGTLQSQYQLQAQPSVMPQLNDQLSQINYDPTALNALQSQALSNLPSAWAQAAQQSNQVLTGNQMSAAGQQANAGQASAYSGLAAHGGLRQGAAQNIALQGQKNLMTADQAAQNQGNLNNLGIQSQDATNKQQMLEQLPSQQAAALQPALQKAGLWANAAQQNQQYQTGVDQQNINTQLQNLGQQNAWNQSNFQTNMGALGAYQTAQATANSKGSLWITGEVAAILPWTTAQYKSIRKLMRLGLKYAPYRTHFYVTQGVAEKGLKNAMEAVKYDFLQLRHFILNVIGLIDANKGREAVEYYFERVIGLCKEFGTLDDDTIKTLYQAQGMGA